MKLSTGTQQRKWVASFLKRLSVHGAPSVACEEVGIQRSMAYRWRDKSSVFAKAWDKAIERSAERLESEATRRAIEGVRRKKFTAKGEPVIDPDTGLQYEEREFSDTLLMFRLKGMKPIYRDGQQTNVNVSQNVSITITEDQRVQIAERRRLALEN